MARLTKIIFGLLALTACISQASEPQWDQSPDFNNCWDIVPPGPDFQQRLEEHMGTTDPNVTELGCIPLYHLNEAACYRFKMAGPAEWPRPVFHWCEKYFDVTLEYPK